MHSVGVHGIVMTGKTCATWSHALWWTAHMGNLQLKLLASDEIRAAFLLWTQAAVI